jgi:hypothetical protein
VVRLADRDREWSRSVGRLDGFTAKRPSITPAPKFVRASDLQALADRLELHATKMRNQEGLRRDLRVAAEAIRELLRGRVHNDPIVSDTEPLRMSDRRSRLPRPAITGITEAP